MKYFAYGANTNIMAMAQRVPYAQLLGAASLLDCRFRFALHADVVPAPGQKVQGVLWEITEECLALLDNFEGFPHYYGRREAIVLFNNEIDTAIIYYMQPGYQDHEPNDAYFQLCLEGYLENSVDATQLHTAKAQFKNDTRRV